MSERQGKAQALPAGLDTLFREAGESFRRGAQRDALQRLERILQEAPGFARGWFLRGFIEGQLGRFQGSADCLARAVALQPGDGEALLYLARAKLKLGLLQDARAAYLRVLAGPAPPAEAHVELGALLQRQGQTDAALEHFRAALRAEPSEKHAAVLAGALTSCERFDEAIDVLKGALEQTDSNRLRRQLGRALSAAKRSCEAIQVLERTLRQAPDDPRFSGPTAAREGSPLRLGGIRRAAGAGRRGARFGGRHAHPFHLALAAR